MRLPRHLAVTLAVLLLATPPALAHAFLLRASPAVGSTIRTPPSELTLRFSEGVEPSFSTVQVIGPGDQRFDIGDPRVDERERTVLRMSLKPLTQGVYTVTWRAVSVDTHVTTGDFKFTVAP
jgi:hypothetical protein